MPGQTENAAIENPLLDLSGLPAFERIRPEHVIPAVDAVLAQARTTVDSLVGSGPPYTWEGLVQPMEDVEERVNRVWSPAEHLHNVADNPALREAYAGCLPKLSDYATEIGQNRDLFEAYRSVAEGPDFTALDVAQRRIVENALRDFSLSGVDLAPEPKRRFREVTKRLSELCNRFEENVLDATQAWRKHLRSGDDLVGLPETALAHSAELARAEGLDGWLLTLDFPSFFPVITYADDPALRREIYHAYTTRASDQGPTAERFDNTAVMEEILALRQELARLLDYSSYAELSLAKKMARSTAQVLEFLTDLARCSRPVAERELAELHDFARAEHGATDLQAWDIAYFSEKLREHRYALSQEDLRPYFPAPRVLQGLFRVVERLYGLLIREVPAVDAWHPDVRFFEVRDEDGLRGQFYLDLYARSHKRGGAWMDECIVRKRAGGAIQIPVAYLNCNFQPPVGNTPSLLTHEEVTTLFHEFGHGLHHMLTRVDYPSVAGINGVAWDAVELPSQFMENWSWEREALQDFSGHVRTGEPLPDEMFRKLRAARSFQAGMQMVRQLEFAIFDFRLHLAPDAGVAGRIREILDEVRGEVAVIRPPAFNRFAHAFTHIFGGGYAAGYYSYKWAEVLSSDAYSRFEENGVFDRATGMEFLHTVLEQGGARDAMELFVEFRGREPVIDALLRHSGILEAGSVAQGAA